MAESVCVGVRVRPFNDREKGLNAEVCIDMDGPTTRIRDSNGKETPFTFDESFWSHDGFVDDGTGYNIPAPGCKPPYADQRYVFETFGQRVLNNAWEGFHCCLFAYGQTGAGKSYSMVGYGKNKGIVPISCEEIFIRIANNDNAEKSYEVTVSMIEIYNETVQDLLIMPEDRPKKGLEIRESKLLGIYIDGVLKRPVGDYKAIERVIDEATSHRTVGSTLMNATSSRAHTVQTIEFKQVETIGGKQQVKISMVNLVDLAGSEKAGQTGATGDRLKEGAAINKSLSALGNVIEKLAEKSSGKGKVLIPYRDSKLTRLLQNALGGSSKTIMICALSPASSNYEETMSTLRYADRAKKIKNTAVINENPQDRLIRELKEENVKLREMMESLAAGGPVDSGKVTEMKEQQKEIEEVEKALAEMEKSFEQRVQEAKEREQEQKMKRRTTLSALMRSTVPQFVNLNEDPQLTGRIKYNLEEGKVTRIGCHKEDSDSEESSSESESDEATEGKDETGNADEEAEDANNINDANNAEATEGKDETGNADEEAEDVNNVNDANNAEMDDGDALKAKLGDMSLEELKDKAQQLGVAAEQLEEAAQAEDPKAELIKLIPDQRHSLDSATLEEKASAPSNLPAKEKEPSESDQSEGHDGLPDILLLSESIYHNHAYVTNKEGRCYLMSVGQPAEATWINGNSIAELLRQRAAAKEGENTGGKKKEMPEESANRGAEKEEVTEEVKEDELCAASDDAMPITRKLRAFTEPITIADKSELVTKAEQLDELVEPPEGILLQHGDRVVFGKCYFFFCIPTEGVAEMMIMSGQVDYVSAYKEMRKNRTKTTMSFGKTLGGAGGVMFAAARFAKGLRKSRVTTCGSAESDAPSDSDIDSADEGMQTAKEFGAILDEKYRQVKSLQQDLEVAHEQMSQKDAIICELQRRLHVALGGDGSAPGAPDLQHAGPGSGLAQKMADALINSGSLRASMVSFTNTGTLAASVSGLSLEDQGLPSLLGSGSRALEPSNAEARSTTPGIARNIHKSFADAINVIDVVEATLTNMKEKKQSTRRKAGKVVKAKG